MRLALTLALTLPMAAFAVGSDDSSPPPSTPTTTTCPKGTVWDARRNGCVQTSLNQLPDSDRLQAVRELAYAGRTQDAIDMLDTISDQTSDMVLTYRGFTARQRGDMAAALTAYRGALLRNPDNVLARSYMGMGLAGTGDLAGAWEQLIEIRARGGAGSWAEAALAETIRTGRAARY